MLDEQDDKTLEFCSGQRCVRTSGRHATLCRTVHRPNHGGRDYFVGHLTGPALVARAEALIRALGQPVAHDPAQGLVPAELAACVARALALPEIVALRPGLLPEFPVYASTLTEEQEEATVGIADAIAFGADGAPQVVVDWKSDVAPAPETIEHYRAQVRAYLDITATERGLIVLATTGVIIPVVRANPAVPAS
jgi:hypothetical protein